MFFIFKLKEIYTLAKYNGFMSSRGAKFPVKELVKELSKHLTIIYSCEWNSSKLCAECGNVLSYIKPKHNGKSVPCRTVMHCKHCPRGKHGKHVMFERNLQAAAKIGLMYLAFVFGEDTGPFQRGKHVKEGEDAGVDGFKLSLFAKKFFECKLNLI